MHAFLSLLTLAASASAFSGVATFNDYAAQSKYELILQGILVTNIASAVRCAVRRPVSVVHTELQ